MELLHTLYKFPASFLQNLSKEVVNDINGLRQPLVWLVVSFLFLINASVIGRPVPGITSMASATDVS